jgi:hypothetical protein
MQRNRWHLRTLRIGALFKREGKVVPHFKRVAPKLPPPPFISNRTSHRRQSVLSKGPPGAVCWRLARGSVGAPSHPPKERRRIRECQSSRQTMPSMPPAFRPRRRAWPCSSNSRLRAPVGLLTSRPAWLRRLSARPRCRTTSPCCGATRQPWSKSLCSLSDSARTRRRWSPTWRTHTCPVGARSAASSDSWHGAGGRSSQRPARSSLLPCPKRSSTEKVALKCPGIDQPGHIR